MIIPEWINSLNHLVEIDVVEAELIQCALCSVPADQCI